STWPRCTARSPSRPPPPPPPPPRPDLARPAPDPPGRGGRLGPMTAPGPRLRAALDEVPAYRAGVPAPPGAYKISSNENPYPPLPSVVEAIARAATAANRYPDFAATRLVAALARRFDVPAAHVAVGTGSVGVLQQVVQATAGAGDEVVLAWRSFE